MKGSYEVLVRNRRIQYKFTINRNITILKGDSATEKTTLIDMILAFQNNKESSGVFISSKCSCVTLSSNNWEMNLSTIQNSPESFEWLILNLNLIKKSEISDILENPSDYIESQKYFSWETFFTDLLRKSTNGTYLEYSKQKLNPAYLQEKESKAILTQIPDIWRNE